MTFENDDVSLSGFETSVEVRICVFGYYCEEQDLYDTVVLLFNLIDPCEDLDLAFTEALLQTLSNGWTSFTIDQEP